VSEARTASDYDQAWDQWSDMIRYHPGARHRRRLVLSLLQGVPARRILDAGCGDGTLVRLLRRAYPTAAITGVDLSPRVVERNRRSLPGISFQTLDVAEQRLSERFDLITCCEVIEHIGDQRAALANLAGMLEVGGRLLLTCPTGPIHSTERTFGHLHHPSPQELATLGAPLGLRIRHTWNWGWPLYRWLKWATNLRPQAALDSFASGPYSLKARALSSALYALNHLNRRDSAGGVQLVVLFERTAG
jgi:SAM-dependent methyltransferase